MLVAPFESSQLQFIVGTSIRTTNISKNKINRLLQQNNKTATVRTLTRRAQVVCDSPDSLADEIKYSEIGAAFVIT